jgi:hypothetical protein
MRLRSGALREWAVDSARQRGLLHNFVFMNGADDRQVVYGPSTGIDNLRKMINTKHKYDLDGVLNDLWHGGFKLALPVASSNDSIPKEEL